MDPTPRDLTSAAFNTIWNAIKHWDIERRPGAGRAHATGSDVMAILHPLREAGLVIENLVDVVGKLDTKTSE